MRDRKAMDLDGKIWEGIVDGDHNRGSQDTLCEKISAFNKTNNQKQL